MNAVISFSLFGSAPLYCEGAVRNVELAKRVYPGWRCRFYIDNTVPRRYAAVLEQRGAEIIHVARSLGPFHGHYWRFWPAADPEIDRFIVRDADSRLNLREKAAVDEWISSGKSFHIMRDHPQHGIRILGGMWGGIGGKLADIAVLIDWWGRFAQRGWDGRFLSEVVFPLIRHDYLCHDSVGHFDDARPFPLHEPMVGTRFVGEVVEIDKPRIGVGENVSRLSGLPSASNEDSALWSQAYERLANELMFADEESARLRTQSRPRPLEPLRRLWAARRLLPAGYSIRRKLSRSAGDDS